MTRFENLPPEVMDAIIAHLDNIELLPLLASSPDFMNYIIDELGRRRVNGKNLAMRWACLHGHLPIIRWLVLSGAPVSTIEIEWNHCQWDRMDTRTRRWVGKKAKILTLYLAATRKQVQAFGLLIKLGARIDCSGLEKKALRRLMNRICNPIEDWALLRLFYEHELHSQICFTHYPQLECVIRRHPTSEVGWPIHMLLNRGVNPNERPIYWTDMRTAPFVAASQLNSEPMVDLPVSQGARINGPHPWREPWPIPILAAAEGMSRNGPGIMKACLRYGANINHCVKRKLRTTWSPPMYDCITPFLAYLNSISHWDQQSNAIHPVQAIGLLIEWGAWVEQPVQPPFQGSSGDPKMAFTMWGLELLLKKWGLEKLETSACFRDTIYCLLQEAVRNGNLGESLARYDKMCSNRMKQVKVPTEWRKLLTYLLNVQQVDPTQLLYDYVIHKGRLSERLLDVGQATIDHLLAAGANIHARLQPNDTTLLEELCRTYDRQQHGDTQSCRAGRLELWKNRQDLIEFLVSRGINSSTETPVTTAIDFLVYGLGELKCLGPCWHSDTLDLVRILRGEKDTVS